MDTALAKVPLDTALAKVPLDTALAKVPLDTALAKVPLDTALAKVPLDTALAKVPLDTALAKVPLDTALAKAETSFPLGDHIQGWGVTHDPGATASKVVKTNSFNHLCLWNWLMSGREGGREGVVLMELADVTSHPYSSGPQETADNC